MKTTTESNIGVRKKNIELGSINLPRLLAKAVLISVCVVLFYQSLYLLSFAILLVSIGAIKVYSLYRELRDFDCSIDLSDVTMEDLMDDLEDR
jgi:hypothetical protein